MSEMYYLYFPIPSPLPRLVVNWARSYFEGLVSGK